MKSSASNGKMPARLMITKMVLENFKSYAGIQEIGPFHKRFSSIVGPNGSGKSNVIDALLFVFGKKAKQLRLNKVSELIHKSAGYPNLESVRVAVHFQLIEDDINSDDDFEIVQGSEFVVSRVAFQNNQSKYSIDGKSSTYTDVGVLLRKHGIDLDNNRFLILQGEVEQIAMMKPKSSGTDHDDGLLEYLEDIIGSNRYITEIDEVAKTIEGINEERVTVVKRVKLAEKDCEKLREPREAAESFLSLEREIRSRQNLLYQLNEHTSTTESELAAQKLAGYTEKLVLERSKLEECNQKLSEVESKYQQCSKEHDDIVTETERISKVRRTIRLRDETH